MHLRRISIARGLVIASLLLSATALFTGIAHAAELPGELGTGVVDEVLPPVSDPAAVVLNDTVDDAIDSVEATADQVVETASETTAGTAGTVEDTATEATNTVTGPHSQPTTTGATRAAREGREHRSVKERAGARRDDSGSVAAAGNKVFGTRVLAERIVAGPLPTTLGDARGDAGGLPFTGSDLIATTMAGLALVACGAALPVLARFRVALVRASYLCTVL